MTSLIQSRHLIQWVLLVGMMLTLVGCSQPQIGDDEQAFGEVDALYTAVTTKRKDLLEDCRKRLTQLESDEKLSSEAFKKLTSIMDQAEGGSWQPAAQRLYDFMRAQRRESSR